MNKPNLCVLNLIDKIQKIVSLIKKNKKISSKLSQHLEMVSQCIKNKNNFYLFGEEMKKLISVSDCLLEVIKQSNDFISFQDFISFIPLKMLD